MVRVPVCVCVVGRVVCDGVMVLVLPDGSGVLMSCVAAILRLLWGGVVPALIVPFVLGVVRPDVGVVVVTSAGVVVAALSIGCGVWVSCVAVILRLLRGGVVPPLVVPCVLGWFVTVVWRGWL